MTITESLHNAVAKLRAAGIENAHYEAVLLLINVLGGDTLSFIFDKKRELTVCDAGRLEAFVELRASGFPLQYILGSWGFRRLTLALRPGVFIPRLETERLVGIILESLPVGRPLVGFEVGTGSGAIALALLDERPDIAVFACDISPDAVAIARENAVANRLADRLTLLVCDCLDAVCCGMRFDFIVSNPPYIDPALRDALPRELSHEPEIALYSANRGRATAERILRTAGDYLADDGALFIEVADYNAQYLAGIAGSLFDEYQILDDQFGKPRFIHAMKPIRTNDSKNHKKI